MRVFDGSWVDWEPILDQTSVTIGVLDGVHCGHRALLAHLDAGLVRVVLTFDPHPLEILRPGTPPRLITTIGERIELLGAAGADCVGVLDLSEIKEQTPEQFISDVLVGKVNAAHVVVGADFRFGKDRAGDVELLKTAGKEHGYSVEPIELVEDLGAPISSSRIRGLIESGHVDEAANLLGSRFTLTNEVVDGDKRGRDIGFPTANLRPPPRKLIPATGVYACFVRVRGEVHPAAVNVGVRPTFGGEELLIEAHILGFSDDIYGEQLTVEFVEYMRPELRFEHVGALVTQMGEDVSRSRDILSGTAAQI
jgi:riboflavin kinase/FMN adenylyltransferase